MLLLNNDISFNLEIIGYEFPQLEKAKYDSCSENWLIIKCRICDHDKEWSFEKPALLTTEIKDLLNWLTELAVGNYSREYNFIIEPIISFKLIERNIFRVSLWAEGLPKWYHGDVRYNLDFELKSLDLFSIIKDLESQLIKFPVR